MRHQPITARAVRSGAVRVFGAACALLWSLQARPAQAQPAKWKDDTRVSALVPRLAARRTPLDEAEKAIAEFLSNSAPNKSEAGKLLFAGLFDTLNAQRSQVMRGLERVSRKQREAADKIRDDTVQLQALQDATPRDEAKVEAFSNQLIWETRIFEDRRKVVRLVCEVPTAIDQRLFALGRVIQQELE